MEDVYGARSGMVLALTPVVRPADVCTGSCGGGGSSFPAWAIAIIVVLVVLACVGLALLGRCLYKGRGPLGARPNYHAEQGVEVGKIERPQQPDEPAADIKGREDSGNKSYVDVGAAATTGLATEADYDDQGIELAITPSRPGTPIDALPDKHFVPQAPIRVQVLPPDPPKAPLRPIRRSEIEMVPHAQQQRQQQQPVASAEPQPSLPTPPLLSQSDTPETDHPIVDRQSSLERENAPPPLTADYPRLTIKPTHTGHLPAFVHVHGARYARSAGGAQAVCGTGRRGGRPC